MNKYEIIYIDTELLKTHGFLNQSKKQGFWGRLGFKLAIGGVSLTTEGVSRTVEQEISLTDIIDNKLNDEHKVFGSLHVDNRRALLKGDTGSSFLLTPPSHKDLFSNLGGPDGEEVMHANISIISQSPGKNTKEESIIRPYVVYTIKETETKPEVSRIPVSINGLGELLFPYTEEKQRGFESPQGDAVVPKVILVKGKPGTGKSTMAIQLMTGMAEKNFRCTYWCSNDNPNSIRDMAVSYGFMKEEDFNRCWLESNIISISNIGHDYLAHIKLGKSIQESLGATNVLFVDSLNISQIPEVDRQLIWDVFSDYKQQNILTFFLLEDYGDEGTEYSRQLIADCEFLADVVIDLTESSFLDYQTRYLKIKKKHYSSQIYGKHLYKICTKKHSFSNVDNSTGIVVFPSIHQYFSKARNRTFDPDQLVQTGLAHLDSILTYASNQDLGNTLPQNASIVIRGIKGRHKLALGLNLLMGGLWKIEIENENKFANNKDVLIIQLDEESDIAMNRVAISQNTHMSVLTECTSANLDNGKRLKWKERNYDCKNDCDLNDFFDNNHNQGKKICFYKWCCDILQDSGGNEKGQCTCQKTVIAGYRPGCITPEEFIWSIDQILKLAKFSRVLFVSTAHLKSGFPLLAQEGLLFRALIDLFKSKNIMSIFMDVEGKGYNEELSYQLDSLADYLINVAPLNRKDIDLTLPKDYKGKEDPFVMDSESVVWSQMEVLNVRGKNYSCRPHALTVINDENGNNELLIYDFIWKTQSIKNVNE